MTHDPTTTPDPDPVAAPDPTPAATPAATPAPASDPLRGSVTSGVWAGLIAVIVLLILLIIFVAQNTQSADIKFLGFEGSASQAVLMLIATVVGMVLAALAGTLRILQLRRRVKRATKR